MGGVKHLNSLVEALCFSEKGQKPEYYVHVNIVIADSTTTIWRNCLLWCSWFQ